MEKNRLQMLIVALGSSLKQKVKKRIKVGKYMINRALLKTVLMHEEVLLFNMAHQDNE